jgi:glutaredoxin-like YruB-family protein
MIKEIQNRDEFKKLVKENEDLLIAIFYTDISEKSKKALEILNLIKEENPELPLYKINVSVVKDIHAEYGVNMVPCILVLINEKVSNIIYGLQEKNYYEMLLTTSNIATKPFKTSSMPGDEEKKHKRVIVYTSPTCSWCAALKSYLKKNNIGFREVDIARDERAGQDLVRRSGQMGVPQTDIEGRIVVGFDKPKLDSILGIRNR